MASPGVIDFATVPGWPNPSPGIFTAMGGCLAPDGVHVADVPSATTIMNSYSASASELSFAKAKLQTQLDVLFDTNFDLKAFIRAGTVTTVTGAGIGTFLATITNNYRSLRASIASAANVAAVNAININAGWPSNP